MAKQGKAPPARSSRSEEALLIRSAESLGRIIGSLQRQLESVGLLLNGDGDAGVRNGRPAHRQNPEGDGNRRTARGGTAGGRRPPDEPKVHATVARTPRRAAKSAVAKKSTPRQSGARKGRTSPRRG